jgi:hypothetical protein
MACGGALATALIASGCGESGSSDQATKTVTQVVVTEVKTVQSPADEPAQETKSASTRNSEDAGTGGGSGSFSMPDEGGRGLQEAQDDVQRVSGNPIFFTDSSDASGQGRMQIIDSNWKVCSQNVAPGTSVNQDTDISFAAVKLGEDCS